MSQKSEQDNSAFKISNKKESLLDAVPLVSSSIKNKKSERSAVEVFEFEKNLRMNFYKPAVNPNINNNFDFIQSVNSNVKFGGFYDGNVNIQFSPSMYIKPFSNLSVYTYRQKNVFIPMKNVKENILPLAAETSGIILIEGLSKIFTMENKITKSVIEFALKNCISFLVNSAFVTNEKQPIPTYNFYYFSASLNF